MTNNDLLTPRFEVTAPYPNTPYKVGDILEFKKQVLDRFYCNHADTCISLETAQECTANFRELAWYENRELSELPGYVKMGNAVVKVLEYDHLLVKYENDNGAIIIDWVTDDTLPATLSDYEAYKMKEG